MTEGARGKRIEGRAEEWGQKVRTVVGSEEKRYADQGQV